MKKLLLVCLMLSGCAHQLELYSRNGKDIGKGTAQELGQKVTITLNDEIYTGSYTYDGGSTIFTSSNATATAYSGNRSATAYGTGFSNTYIPGSGQGRVFARSESGKAIRCEFSFKDFSGLGICQDNDNNMYDLVIH